MDAHWQTRLTDEIRAAQRIVVLGVGNPDKGDDGAGPCCVELIKSALPNRTAERMLVLNGREVPESQTGPIRKYGPELTIIVDAALGGHESGGIFIVDRDKIADTGISTHQISLLYLVRYLEESIGSRVTVVGIEPESMAEGAPMSAAALRAAEILAAFLSEAPAHHGP
jgi:hydrogenase 3 maturation protease